MRPDTALVSRPAPAPAHPLIRGLNDVAPAADLTLVGPPPRADTAVRSLGRALRERFQAITGLGLSPKPPGHEAPGRNSMAARDGAPALSYLEAGEPSGRKVVFVHGTPGSAADWAGFLHARAPEQHRLAIDRPGFGGSGPGEPVVSLAEQARAIAGLVDGAGSPAVIVASSYGGPVALRLAADRPDLVGGLLLVGGAADPRRERIHPLQSLAARALVSAMLPRALAHSNAELLALRRELELLAADLARIQASVTILHGLDDTLVPAPNARYLAERLTGAARLRFVLVSGAGHFLHLLAPGHVEDALAELLRMPGGASRSSHSGTPA